jgi:hypothetical protein
MQAIGIETGKPFNPDERTKSLLSEAATIGGAIARANTYASPSKDVFYYPDRKWQQMGGGLSYTFLRDGIPQIDARNNVYYMAAGNSPAMMEKNVGAGSQYLGPIAMQQAIFSMAQSATSSMFYRTSRPRNSGRLSSMTR